MKFILKTLGTTTFVAWVLVFFKYVGITDNPADIGQVYVLLYGAFMLTGFTILSMIFAILTEPTVEIGKGIHSWWEEMTPEEKQECKQTAQKAESNYQAYKSGEKGKVSAFFDTFF